MGGRGFLILLWAALLPVAALAQDAPVRLHAPDALRETGLIDHILPRFSLKTQVRVKPSAEGEADIALGDTGPAVFSGPGERVWQMDLRHPDNADAKRLADWLMSEVGRNTVQSYAPEGTPLFGPPPARETAAAKVSIDGDAVLGLEVSRTKCTRCHSVEAGTGFAGISSTPSFAVLRSLPDWADRFDAFYALNPHPAFTQVEGVSEPFPENRPSPIVPIEMTLDEVEAVRAYVATMKAADLGAPLQHQ
ncbi:MAG: hypothetical protein CML50_01115 [Rhodobacteraceae bacterium]|jgi:mono/diheme cytochrome c family protein|nr:hypothetical protein [Paracoccaceae bacterium]GGA12152.1 hypothetical protein GCM10011326_25020 [Salipiger profundus]SFD23374.1 hypothetical protein SAMN05444415_108287 [Salipiger profundus]